MECGEAEEGEDPQEPRQRQEDHGGARAAQMRGEAASMIGT